MKDGQTDEGRGGWIDGEKGIDFPQWLLLILVRDDKQQTHVLKYKYNNKCRF